MKMSKRWRDNGSRTVPMIDVSYRSGCSVLRNGEQYIVTLRFERENQDAKRAEMHDTESTCLDVTLVEARELVAALQRHIESLEFYSRNGTWPPL